MIYAKWDEQTINHFQVMNDKTIFHRSPTKLAKRTWYWTGMNQKLMVLAMGQIFQLFIKVSPIFYLHTFTPLEKEFISLSITIWLTGKKPVRSMGANRSWSKAIDPRTLTVLLTAGKRAVCILGRSLQYQTWSAGAIYPNPITKKSMFLFQLNSFFSKTNDNVKYTDLGKGVANTKKSSTGQGLSGNGVFFKKLCI